ncbi:MAG TPA: TetR/AcrR family transcriptional regulator [Geminicoccus sp.]|nr:TetR/AcrR family transcriptional regulator [Geminicoccus sp.]
MGIVERGCLEKTRNEARRQQVLKGATDCFCRHGFHSASMAEIARSAGMSVGHIYHYFENKEAIIAAIVQNNQAEILATMDMIERCQRPLSEALIEAVGTGVDKCMAHQDTALMIEVLAEAARNPKVAAVLQASDSVLRARMGEMLRKAAKPGTDLSDGRLEGHVETLFTLFQGISVRAIRNPGLNRDRMVRTMQGVIRWLLDN